MMPDKGASISFTSRGNLLGTSLGLRGQSKIVGVDKVLGPDEMESNVDHLDKELGWLLRMDDVVHCKATLGVFDSVGIADLDEAG